MGAEQTTNNRVSGRELYKEFGEMERRNNDRMDNMERRILNQLSKIPDLSNQVINNTKEIDNLRSRSNMIDSINAFIAIVGATIAGIIGSRAP